MGYRSSLIVGILGLIPFVIIFLCCLITPADQEVYDLLIYLFISYAAIISSFLGGIQWGLITAVINPHCIPPKKDEIIAA